MYGYNINGQIYPFDPVLVVNGNSTYTIRRDDLLTIGLLKNTELIHNTHKVVTIFLFTQKAEKNKLKNKIIMDSSVKRKKYLQENTIMYQN